MKIVLGLESIFNACVHTLSRVRLFVTPWTLAHQALCPWDSPGKNTGVGCHFFLQGIFPTQGLNPLLLRLWHCQVDSLPLYHLGSPLYSINLNKYYVPRRQKGERLLCVMARDREGAGLELILEVGCR